MTEFAIGQVWVTPGGLAYTIEARESIGWKVSIHRHTGKNPGAVTASAKPWFFTEAQLHHQAKAKQFHLYNENAVAKIDALAARLEQKGKTVLAAALDDISHEYAEGMLPKRTKQYRVERTARQLETLKKELKDATDPTVIQELSDQINQKARILETDGPGVTKPNPIAPPDGVTDPLKVTDPKFVSRA